MIKDKNHRIIFLSIISAVLLRLSFPKFSLYPLAFVALFPFFLALMEAERSRTALISGLIFGFVFHYSNIFWLNTISAYNFFAIFGIFILGVYLAAYVAVFGWLAFKIHHRLPRFTFLTFPSLWVVLEYIRNMGQLAFPWSYVSATQSYNTPLIQVADITGVWGISFIVVAVNVIIAELIHYRKEGKDLKPSLKRAVIIASALVLLFVYGIIRMNGDYTKEPEIKVAAVQPNITQKEKYASYAGDQNTRLQLQPVIEEVNFNMLSRLEDENTDLVILPESCFTSPYFELNRELHQRLSAESKRLSAGIILGANREVFFDSEGNITDDHDEIAGIGCYNSAWWFRPDGQISGNIYDKVQLVPFGESLPYFDKIPGFRKLIVQTGSFLRGKNYEPFTLPVEGEHLKFSTGICFESAFGRLFRRFANEGADFLLIITNDAWYEDSAGPYQHNQLAVFRAVETRRWLVRCSNRGISCYISPSGKIVKKTELNKRTIISGMIKPGKAKTVYLVLGDFFIIPLVLFLLGVTIYIIVISRRKAK